MSAGLYVHFPFCRSRCSYCDFYSTTKGKEEITDYIALLKKEAAFWTQGLAQFSDKKPHPKEKDFFQARSPKLKNDKIALNTVYFGGGTPSLLSGQQIQELLNYFRQIFHFCPEMEISMEANPDSIHPDWLPEYQDVGINRISIGIQSMNDNELIILKRRSREIQNSLALELLQKHFSNLSADLMIGIPAQNRQSLLYTLEHPALQELPHISCYLLSVPKKSLLQKQINNSTVFLPSETETVAMYRKTIAILKQKKLHHYEISNFAKPGHKSIHNLKYWQNTPYIGLGPTAGGYTGHIRYLNQPTLSSWKLQLEGKKNYFFLKKYQVKDAILEDIMLQFRLLEGISCKRINFWAQNYPRLGIYERIERLVRNKWLKFFRNHIMLTKKGLLFANEVFKEFLD